MSFSTWIRTPRVRRSIALAAIVLSTGGLVLHKAPAAAFPGASSLVGPKTPAPLVAGKNSVAFSGAGAHGMVSLSHKAALVGQQTSVYADIRVVADAQATDEVRAPLAMAVVLDTSGSMSGDKIEDAKRSVLKLIDGMRDDDEIAFVRYSDRSELVQPLARVGSVRASLTARVREINADGGTNIPAGLEAGLRALDASSKGRVKRIVVVSDGLDATRARAESLARSSFASGITVSSLGIGLDFDESYMGSLAQNGHGNFAFVNDGGSLASFLTRELEQTATTTIEDATVTLRLPAGLMFVSATGAEVQRNSDGSVALTIGSMFAGDERRVIVELSANPYDTGSLGIQTSASWRQVGAGRVTTAAPSLVLASTRDGNEVEAGRDGAVLASAVSVIASRRQVEAASAYSSGDVDRAARIAADNEKALDQVMALAPPAAATSLAKQKSAYGEQRKGFLGISPQSAGGKAAAKAAAAKEMENFDRKAW
jgi:Ca-activated chloride channel family protein